MPTYNLTERTIEDLQREVDRLRGALREIISMCSGQSGTPWKVKELATHALGAPPPARMDAPDGPVCGCGKPSRHESGWCGECVR